MKICIISSNYFTKNRAGGFASMSKHLAISLRDRGHTVVLLVPQQYANDDKEKGISIVGISIKNMFNARTYTSINADIYHSQNQNIISTLAMHFEKDKKHVITCRDPRDLKDWLVEFNYATLKRRLKIPLTYFFEEGPLAFWTIRKADVIGCPAEYLKDKIKKMHHLTTTPLLLPNIEHIPDKIPAKSSEPSVCYVGRLDRRKRPELVFDLAKKFPHVHFTIVGCSEEKARQEFFEQQAKKLPNVTMHGALNKFSDPHFYDTYNTSWILINTSAREGLPLTFIEAAGRGCALLSFVNPDKYASRFGYHAHKLDFEKGLGYLLTHNRWKSKGNKAYSHVKNIYSAKNAIDTHIALYEELLRR